MDNPRPDKAAKVDEIAEKLESAGTVVVTEYRSLDVPAQAELRQAVRAAGGEYKIYKNSLTKIAAERTGNDFTITRWKSTPWQDASPPCNPPP